MQSVAMMNRIIAQAEAWIEQNKEHDGVVSIKPSTLDTYKGIAYGIVEASKNLHAVCIIAITRSGNFPQLLAKYRPNVPIVTFVPDAKTARLLQINRGIYPVLSPQDVDLTSQSTLSSNERCDLAIRFAKEKGFCKTGDTVILASADRASNMMSAGSAMRVVSVL